MAFLIVSIAFLIVRIVFLIVNIAFFGSEFEIFDSEFEIVYSEFAIFVSEFEMLWIPYTLKMCTWKCPNHLTLEKVKVGRKDIQDNDQKICQH